MEQTLITQLHFDQIFQKLTLGLINSSNQGDEVDWRNLFEETQRGRIWVTDDASVNHCVFVLDTKGIDKNKLLEVTQTTRAVLLLWHIDGAMFKKFSKGDCALIQNKKLHLIEFKANVTSDNDLTIKEHYEKAASQILGAYEIITRMYKNVNLKIEDIFSDVDAMIVFNPLVPRINATQQSFKAKFIADNHMFIGLGNKLELD